MTTTLVITADDVWTRAADLRAVTGITYQVATVTSKDVAFCFLDGDLPSLQAVAAVLTDAGFRSQLYEPGRHIVSVSGTYRGMPVEAQSIFPLPDIALAALRAGGR